MKWALKGANLSKKKELIAAIDNEIEQTLADMRKEGVSDTERLIMSASLENLSRLKTGEVSPGFDDQVKHCLCEMEVARLKGDVDTYHKLAQSLDSITKSQANLVPKDGGIARAIVDGLVTLAGTLIIANFDRLHVLPRNVIDWFKFSFRKR